MISRRTFVATATGGLVTLAARVGAQDARPSARIGWLSPLSASTSAHIQETLRERLQSLGRVEGRNLSIELRYAEGDATRLPELAKELVRLKVDLIVAGSTPAALAAKAATSTIPIVMVMGGDPVARGLAASMPHPGGNVTGVTALVQELSGKRIQLLKEAVPGLARVAFLSDPAFPDNQPSVEALAQGARALGVRLRVLEIRQPGEIEKSFATIAREHDDALMVEQAVMFNEHRRQIVELAARGRLPAMYGLREFVDAGGLMYYGASLQDMYSQAAILVDKVLRGEKPGDLPIEQPTKFELWINLRTAKTLRLTIPQALLLRADHVIESP
jgi:putative ABC transport system substrate-binding protein